jgi:hypothetical protein
MMVADINLLGRLQDWYVSQCDGGWEHAYGISIATLDNPGWKFNVDLTDTDLIGRTFDDILFEGKDNNDWYQCRIRDDDFEGHCGPHHLSDVIAIFLNWADGNG